MRAVDIIEKKRRGSTLSADELQALLTGYIKNELPDYQMSAFLMAVLWRGMTSQELADFTRHMVASGDQLDLSEIPGIKVDKHSTGGVGDKTTLILAPLLASVGVPVAKMSGRGLGHTGGTVDKLESIPGFHTNLTSEDFIRQVRGIGVAVAGQTGNLAPADKRIYALRDVTGTVESIPLIASSIMSKKLASGADAIVLDVKVGDGAFMKTKMDAIRLAKTMVDIGSKAGRETVAVLSSMAEPLGRAIGNALEVREAIQTLQNEGPEDLVELCLALGSEMVLLAGRAQSAEAARQLLVEALADGSALEKFRTFVAAQGGDRDIADSPDKLPQAPVVKQLKSLCSGVVAALPALRFGEAAMRLGAGRETKDDVIDPAVGLVLTAKIGDAVEEGDALVEVHARDEASADECLKELRQIVEISAQVVGISQNGWEVSHKEVEAPQLILGTVRGGDTVDLHVEEDAAKLIEAAAQARTKAYVPYSQFAVGAAIQFKDGRIVTGANIENVSYGLTNCAERTAVFSGLATRFDDKAEIGAIAVVADSPDPVSPCGACRQVLAEFSQPDTPVYLGNLKGDVLTTTVAELLPMAFDSKQMASVICDGEIDNKHR